MLHELYVDIRSYWEGGHHHRMKHIVPTLHWPKCLNHSAREQSKAGGAELGKGIEMDEVLDMPGIMDLHMMPEYHPDPTGSHSTQPYISQAETSCYNSSQGMNGRPNIGHPACMDKHLIPLQKRQRSTHRPSSFSGTSGNYENREVIWQSSSSSPGECTYILM
jgi:hypothetical protein